MTAYIAKIVQGDGYVLTVDGVVTAGPFDTAAEAVKAREKLERARRSAEQLPA